MTYLNSILNEIRTTTVATTHVFFLILQDLGFAAKLILSLSLCRCNHTILDEASTVEQQLASVKGCLLFSFLLLKLVLDTASFWYRLPPLLVAIILLPAERSTEKKWNNSWSYTIIWPLSRW